MQQPDDKIVVRLATAADAAIIAEHRTQMFYDMGSLAEELVEPMRQATVAYLQRTMPAGEYVGWLAYELQKPSYIIAGAGVLIRQIPPFATLDASGNRRIAKGKQGLVVNVYANPSVRRHGVATLVMNEILDWSSRERIDRLVLHASEQGRPLYEKLGFVMTNEMRYAPPVLHTS
ncbi:MAG: GNAT family N-acetyltransferase [Gemmatimonadaceae bacterium]